LYSAVEFSNVSYYDGSFHVMALRSMDYALGWVSGSKRKIISKADSREPML
jgi:hypothetical protein